MVLFAWYAHAPWPAAALGGAGLVATGVAIVIASPHQVKLSTLIGLRFDAAPPMVLSILGAGVGVAAGLAQRASLHLPLARDFALGPFVIVACLIGATEEVIYRGWLLSRLRALGWPAAIVVSAVAHAAYKTALFAQPAVAVPIDHLSLALYTAAGGLVLGTLRVVSGSLWPALIAHAVFDFVVYRAVAHAPWWVWG